MKLELHHINLSTRNVKELESFYKDILFLDEATSSIDTITEKKIMDSIEKMYSGKTIIMIAHRISTLNFCDKVIELNNGRIINVHGKEWISKRCKEK